MPLHFQIGEPPSPLISVLQSARPLFFFAGVASALVGAALSLGARRIRPIARVFGGLAVVFGLYPAVLLAVPLLRHSIFDWADWGVAWSPIVLGLFVIYGSRKRHETTT